MTEQDVKAELERCRNDLGYFCSKYVYTTNPSQSSRWTHKIHDKCTLLRATKDMTFEWQPTFHPWQETLMKITECGKYRTRSGAAATVHMIASLGAYPVHGYSDLRVGRKHLTWTLGGAREGYLCSADDLVEKVFEITETGWYKTRDGQLVEVTELDGLLHEYPIGGKVEDELPPLTWTPDGLYMRNHQGYKYRDIVAKAEAPEPEQLTVPEWALGAFQLSTPGTDTEIRGADVHIGNMDSMDAQRDMHFIGCKITVEAQEHDEYLFGNCIFEQCIIEGNRSLLENGFGNCKLVDSFSFSDIDSVLSIELRG